LLTGATAPAPGAGASTFETAPVVALPTGATTLDTVPLPVLVAGEVPPLVGVEMLRVAGGAVLETVCVTGVDLALEAGVVGAVLAAGAVVLETVCGTGVELPLEVDVVGVVLEAGAVGVVLVTGGEVVDVAGATADETAVPAVLRAAWPVATGSGVPDVLAVPDVAVEPTPVPAAGAAARAFVTNEAKKARIARAVAASVRRRQRAFQPPANRPVPTGSGPGSCISLIPTNEIIPAPLQNETGKKPPNSS
jgi:hypothetical protein